MRYLLVLSMIGAWLSGVCVSEQARRYVLADHALEAVRVLESFVADPLEGRVQEFVADPKVAKLIETTLQANTEEKRSLFSMTRETYEALKDRALFDGAIWAVQLVILALVASRLNDARRGRRPLGP